ncbi:hypothetical protein I3842_09G213300 [Carya illinoinensis]|uniref:Uncharacterized protein n=1 Tax=Carya illinoinensis TaxID=32201 RepID=A0A922E6Q8_CARIL|nr:hypothetical protein I3842_09G213300 [Carya illinoinensis]
MRTYDTCSGRFVEEETSAWDGYQKPMLLIRPGWENKSTKWMKKQDISGSNRRRGREEFGVSFGVLNREEGEKRERRARKRDEERLTLALGDDDVCWRRRSLDLIQGGG